MARSLLPAAAGPSTTGSGVIPADVTARLKPFLVNHLLGVPPVVAQAKLKGSGSVGLEIAFLYSHDGQGIRKTGVLNLHAAFDVGQLGAVLRSVPDVGHVINLQREGAST